MTLPTSKKSCSRDSTVAEIFFSLVDYRNSRFTSENPDKVIEFYDSFKDRDDLIEWMKERPKGVANLYEVDGDKEIIVVIPTADFNGKYAKECRENLFKGLHTIFVESGEVPDPYFNYAHNCNVGIRKAIVYNPKWIVLSNDDMIKIDAVEKLKEQLLELDENKFDVVFTVPSKFHSSPMKISAPNLLHRLYYCVTNRYYGRVYFKIYKKFGIRYLSIPTTGIYSRLFKKGYEYLELEDFGIYSSGWIKKTGGEIYDETFVNSAEDTDLSIRISVESIRTGIIGYKIGDLFGSTFGTGTQRRLRGITGLTYFNFKWSCLIEEKIRGFD